MRECKRKRNKTWKLWKNNFNNHIDANECFLREFSLLFFCFFFVFFFHSLNDTIQTRFEAWYIYTKWIRRSKKKNKNSYYNNIILFRQQLTSYINVTSYWIYSSNIYNITHIFPFSLTQCVMVVCIRLYLFGVFFFFFFFFCVSFLPFHKFSCNRVLICECVWIPIFCIFDTLVRTER